MRALSSTIVTFPGPDAVLSAQLIQRFVDSANAPDLERKIQEELSKLIGTPYQLSFLDLAGGGDGHNFVVDLEFTDSSIPQPFGPQGIAVQDCLILAYAAADALELTKARAAAQRRAVPFFNQVASQPNFDRLRLIQTALSGSEQGTRFMGLLVFQAIFAEG
jgi:hypothetical protein